MAAKSGEPALNTIHELKQTSSRSEGGNFGNMPTGDSLNIIKEKMVAEKQPLQQVMTKCCMGNDKHEMNEITPLKFLEKEHNFVITLNNFPLQEDSIL